MVQNMRTKIDIPGPLGQPVYRHWWGSQLTPLARLLTVVLPRLFDWLFSLLLIGLLAPLLIVRGFISQWQSGQVFTRTSLLGRYQTPFQKLAFAGKGKGRRLAVLFNILRGDMAFAGPRPLSKEEAAQVPVDALVRFSIRPGLTSPHQLQQRVAIAHEAESVTDKEFVYSETLKGDAGLIARSAISNILGGGAPKPSPPTLKFFGISMINTTMDEAINWIVTQTRCAEKSHLAFVNPDCLNIAYTHTEYSDVLRKATRVLPDGIGIHVGCRMLGVSLRANVNGTDLFPRLCEKVVEQNLSLFLLGAKPGIADAVAANMQKRYSGLQIVGTQHGYFSPDEEASIIQKINASGANILLVAFGAPKQDIWINSHLADLKPAVSMGVGGLFDFYSGQISRAPLWMREIGMEWIWRLIQEPGRLWRRYVIGNPLFLFRVWKQGRQ